MKRFWVGVRSLPGVLEFALVDGDGRLCDRIHLQHERRVIIRVVKQWVKRFAFDPELALFCLEENGQDASPLLHFVLEQKWELRFVAPVMVHAALALSAAEPVEASHLALFVQRSPNAARVLSPGRAQHERVEHLRRRREQLLQLKAQYTAQSADQARTLSNELRKEFERMERRHMQLLDSFILRLDTLISVQVAARIHKDSDPMGSVPSSLTT
jgi:hypothetical protein